MDENILAEGRSCGSCTLCCKIMSINEINKPENSWCVHCDIGKGCKIYPYKPIECSNFYCGYMQWNEFPEYWFPAHSKIIITAELDGNRTAFRVDPTRPDAWEKEPYYSEIKAYSEIRPGDLHQVVVFVGKHTTVIYPERDIDLGIVEDDESVVTTKVKTSTGFIFDALKLKSDDPRLKESQKS